MTDAPDIPDAPPDRTVVGMDGATFIGEAARAAVAGTRTPERAAANESAPPGGGGGSGGSGGGGGAGGGSGGRVSGGASAAARKRAQWDTNDEGMARRLAFYSKGRLIACPHLADGGNKQGWLVWDGRRYRAEDGMARARREVIKVGGKIKSKEYVALREAGLTDEERALAATSKSGETEARKSYHARLKRAWAGALTLGNNARQKAVLEVGAALEPFLVDFHDLDSAPARLNTASGVIDLPTHRPDPGEGGDHSTAAMEATLALELRPARPRDRITRVTSASVDLDALKAGEELAPTWSAHLALIQPDNGMRLYLQRVLGSMLVSLNPDEKFFIFRGPGGDGKSVTVSVVRKVLGDYARSGDVKSLLHDKHASAAGPRQDLVRMAGGNRLFVFSEPEKGAQLSDGTIKLLTGGGDEVSTRAAYGSQFEFEPQFKMLMMCNALPFVKGEDQGFWRRTEVVPFRHPIPDDLKDPAIMAKLLAERDGILHWLIEGYLDWWSRGFDYAPPDAARDATRGYRRDVNPFIAWVEDRIRWGGWIDTNALDADGYRALRDRAADGDAGAQGRLDSYFLPATRNSTRAPRYTPTAIYQDFCAWCEEAGLEPYRQNGFSKTWATKAQDSGARDRRSGGVRSWEGFDFVDGTPRHPGAEDLR